MADSNSTPNRFYVYVHRRQDDGSVFYVGKGSGRRAFSKHGRSVFWKRIVNKHGFKVDIVRDKLLECDAFAMEVEVISIYGLENLCNHTTGGEGASGRKRAAEEIERAAEKIRGIKRPQSVIDALRNAHKGIPLTKEHKEKLSNARKGRPMHPNTRRALIESRFGVKASNETREKLREIAKERFSNKDFIEKMVIAKSNIVVCSNGMEFLGTNRARDWVRENTKYKKAAQSNIWFCCKGKAKTAYGFTWRYKHE